MKLLSSSLSSLSSSSSTRTTSFDSKSATASCLTGILRRILCSGTLPTHPSDHITDDSNSDLNAETYQVKHNTTLVARLMGLDSMPETNFRTSISRSRSMNYADRIDDRRGRDAEKLHRRVKSTDQVVPVFLELENDEFLVLSFEDESKLKKRRRERRKVLSDLNGRDSTVCLVSKKIPCRKRNVGSDSEAVKVRKPKKMSDNLVNSKKKKSVSKFVKTVKVDQINSEDSSPVSVLNCGQFLVDPKLPISEDGSTISTTSRRKLSLDTIDENSDGKSPRRDDNLIVGEERKPQAKQRRYVDGSRKTRSDWHESSSDVLDEICRASEAELLGASWARKWTSDNEEFQSIGEILEAQVIGQLIEELITQFD